MPEQNRVRTGPGGATRSSAFYGTDYLSELSRVVNAYAPARPRAVLEWGMGNSTLQFLSNRDALAIASLDAFDDDETYFAQLLLSLPQWEGFHPRCVDLMGLKRSDRDPEPNYATFPLTLGRSFDLVFIDGRRRMECALAAALVCRSDGIVMLHDYRRERYQLVRLLYDIVEDGPQFRVMRPRNEILAIREHIP